jgi:radical SAM protein with 4Fe4S-binding SPASM domain
MARGIGELHRLRPDFPIAARCTVQKQNCASLVAVVETARALGLQSISFLAADLTSSAFNRPDGWTLDRQAEIALDSSELLALEQDLDALIASRADDFILETSEKLRRIALHFRAHLGLAEPTAPRCNAPWVSAVVESDGTLRPCFFHVPIGNVRAQSLREALNSPQAQVFRESLRVAENPVCRRCVCSLYLPGGELPQ